MDPQPNALTKGAGGFQAPESETGNYYLTPFIPQLLKVPFLSLELGD